MITSFTQSGHAGAVPHCCGYFDEGAGEILVQQVLCSGPEENVTSCSYSNSTSNDPSMMWVYSVNKVIPIIMHVN